MIKKIQIELSVFTLILISIFFYNEIDQVIHNYFTKPNYSAWSVYFKKFFISITELGDSLWYFLIFFLIFIFSFIAKKINIISLKKYSYLKNISIFSFSYLFLVGTITQIIKHLVGRPRPNYTNLNENLEFIFLSTNSTFHSFPSGHASTIIATTIIASLMIPGLRSFFYICGALIALSRVVVGAHFMTDVTAGALLAIIIYKILNLYFNNKFPNLNSNNFEIKNISPLTKYLVIFLITAVFITVGPSLDIFFSSLFYSDDNKFFLQSYDLTSIIIRKTLLPFVLFYIFILPVLSKFIPIKKFFFNHKFNFKEIIFIWISGLTTLLLVVNVLLKDIWGRVRPNEIIEFGGVDIFTPWYKFGNSCDSNCSFVSGDASVGYVLVLFYFITKKNIYIYISLFLGTFFGFTRILAGGHFFSDVIFSQLVVIISLSIFFNLYKKLYDK